MNEKYNQMEKNSSPLTGDNALFATRVASALGIDVTRFDASSTAFYTQVKRKTGDEPVALRSYVKGMLRDVFVSDANDLLPTNGGSIAEQKTVFIEGAAELAARGAIATARIRKRKKAPIEEWWGHVAAAVIEVDRTTQTPQLTKDGTPVLDTNGEPVMKVVYEGPGPKGIVFNNHGTRDRVLMRYGDHLNRLNPPKKKS